MNLKKFRSLLNNSRNVRGWPFTDIERPLRKMPKEVETATCKHRRPRRFPHFQEPIVVSSQPTDHLTSAIASAYTREHGARILCAIARDPRHPSSLAGISIGHRCSRQYACDRQVHLRLYGADGLQEKTVAVDMAAMHYVTTSGAHASYRVEIDIINQQMSGIPLRYRMRSRCRPGVSETTDVDLATIPFHVAFQQLLNLFRTGLRPIGNGALASSKSAALGRSSERR